MKDSRELDTASPAEFSLHSALASSYSSFVSSAPFSHFNSFFFRLLDSSTLRLFDRLSNRNRKQNRSRANLLKTNKGTHLGSQQKHIFSGEEAKAEAV